MPLATAALSVAWTEPALESTAASNPSWFTSQSHFAAPPAMPTTRHPLILPIWPTNDPTDPAAAETTIVSPGCGRPMRRSPKYAVSPAMPYTLKRCVSGSIRGTLLRAFALLGLGHRAFAHAKMLRAELCLRPRDENDLPVLHTPLPCFVAAAFLPRSSDDGRPFRAVHALACP